MAVVEGGATDGVGTQALIMEVTDSDGTTQAYSMGATTSIKDLVDEINMVEQSDEVLIRAFSLRKTQLVVPLQTLKVQPLFALAASWDLPQE